MLEITLATAGVIALITALVQVGKGLGLASKYAPLASIGLGILISVGVTDVVTAPVIISGVASGLSAIGLYSVGGKTVLTSLSGK